MAAIGRLPMGRTAIAAASLVAIGVLVIFAWQQAERASANPATGLVSVAAGNRHTCGLTSAGGVKCWGANDAGQLGVGANYGGVTPVDVVGLSSGVAAISAGDYHTCALMTAGGLKCWGDDYRHAIGDGGGCGAFCYTPVDVTGLTSGVLFVGAGGRHTCAVTTAGAAKCWGANDGGQLGDGTTTERSTPIDVVGLSSGVTAVTAASDHSCALMSGGNVKCWGYNSYGELGDGTINHHQTPVDVIGLPNGATSVDASNAHTCAVTPSGGVKCWGEGGLLGQAGACGFQCSTPVDVTGLTSGVTAVSASYVHTCVLTSGGGVKCWGYNGAGRLGDGTLTNHNTPVDVVGLTSGVFSVSAGWFHTCAIMQSGGAKCWGMNINDQLGSPSSMCEPSTACSTTPLDVIQTIKPTPTATPCPTEGCPTATPTRTPTPTPTATPCPGTCPVLDFSIGVVLGPQTGNACDSSGSPTMTCRIAAGADFLVSLHLNSLPTELPNAAYDGYQARIQYSGVSYNGVASSFDSTPWPACELPKSLSNATDVRFACLTGIGRPPSGYTGVMATVKFTCAADGILTLVHGTNDTSLDYGNQYYIDADGTESLNIECVAPQAYPGDTDGDHCPDAKESGMNQGLGGKRNYLNPWDYFNPTQDGVNRSDDIAAQVMHYGDDQGSPGYDTRYDRSPLPGANPWQFGPPDGMIRSLEITAAVLSYGHDCS